MPVSLAFTLCSVVGKTKFANAEKRSRNIFTIRRIPAVVRSVSTFIDVYPRYETGNKKQKWILLRADVCKYRPEVGKMNFSKNPPKIM